MVVKYKTMAGFRAPYIPGWDCHGLPIEVKVMAELGDAAKTMTKPEIRKHCQKYAGKYVKLQSMQFKSLGVFGDFENPYLTLKPQYEKGILEIFANWSATALSINNLNPSIGPSAANSACRCGTGIRRYRLASVNINFAGRASSQKPDPCGFRCRQTLLMIWTCPWTWRPISRGIIALDTSV
jgi:isoleucyl-tRNA synthetase